MKIVPGEQIAEKIKQDVKNRVAGRMSGPAPKLVIIYAGENPSSEIYVRKKVDWAEQVGIAVEVIRLPETSTEELLSITDRLNKDSETTGYIVQLPLPEGLDTKKILESIAVEKDIDGLNPLSLGMLFHGHKPGRNFHVSATALAVLECLSYISRYSDDGMYTEDEFNDQADLIESKSLQKFLQGKNVLIINHSILVGKPLTAIFLNMKATVSIAHKFTQKDALQRLINESDIIVTATGQPGTLNFDMIHEGQIIIDVGINKSAEKIGGDVDVDGMKDMDIWLTPVPNGVGPITVSKLLSNLVSSSQ